MKVFILSEIKSKICCIQCVPAWKDFQTTLPELLDGFDPKVSNDGVKISYQEGKGRYSLSIMRFLTRKLKLLDLFDEVKISQVSDSITQGFFSGEFKVRLDKGVTITENYKNNVGGGSCMSGSCSQYTRLYEMNPDRFEQLVITHKNNSARAIIATLDNGKKFQCRAYSDNSVCRIKLESYACEQGWKVVDVEDMIVSDLKWVEGGFPYQDNFMIYNIQGNGNITLGSSAAFDKSNVSPQGDTDVQYGYLENEPTHCYNCSVRIEGEGVIIQDNEYCEGCVDELFNVCNECEEYVYCDNAVMIEDENYCERCSRDVGSFCEHCSKLVLSESINVVEDEEGDTVGTSSSRRTIEVCDECYENVSFTLIREKAV